MNNSSQSGAGSESPTTKIATCTFAGVGLLVLMTHLSGFDARLRELLDNHKNHTTPSEVRVEPHAHQETPDTHESADELYVTPIGGAVQKLFSSSGNDKTSDRK